MNKIALFDTLNNSQQSIHSHPQSLDLHSFDHLLHGRDVTKFEEALAKYAGAKYACTFNSASSAIFLIFKMLAENSRFMGNDVELPSVLPPAVPNAVIAAGWPVVFTDDVSWIGSYYVMADFGSFKIIDSAQVLEKDIYANITGSSSTSDLMIFSFYPTKPAGGLDGGAVVSNNKDVIERLRELSLNGTDNATNSWDRRQRSFGYKMYMNSVQAHVAHNRLLSLYARQHRMSEIREMYDNDLDGVRCPTTKGQCRHHHLYRLYVDDNEDFVRRASLVEIGAGIHYKALHLNPLYAGSVTTARPTNQQSYQRSMLEHLQTVSIPFHSGMTNGDVARVIEFTNKYVGGNDGLY